MSKGRNIVQKFYFYFVRELNKFMELPINIVGQGMLFAAGVKRGKNLRLYGLPIISMVEDSRIEIGKNCRLRSRSHGNAIGVNHPVILRTIGAGAVLSIGDDFGMSGGAICAAGSVQIGNRVMVGANTVISDSDFHSLNAGHRANGVGVAEFRKVVIDDDVWIGADVYVGKGVTIGRASIVGAKSVVTRDVPPNSIVAGNPAKIIRFSTQ
ncbi:acyltransferase [Xanthobacter autotrophicus]|uniref:acyltransferase n=1 Tax=Xanthobacter autotrophicus TaxID=280 RepID=UPI002B4BB4C4|nr:acyltransferase [Xanthobacter autotrophicus]